MVGLRSQARCSHPTREGALRCAYAPYWTTYLLTPHLLTGLPYSPLLMMYFTRSLTRFE
jgi:hypothetical protein